MGWVRSLCISGPGLKGWLSAARLLLLVDIALGPPGNSDLATAPPVARAPGCNLRVQPDAREEAVFDWMAISRKLSYVALDFRRGSQMPTVRFLMMQADFATADEASAVLGGVLTQFRGGADQASQIEPAPRSPAALPPSHSSSREAPVVTVAVPSPAAEPAASTLHEDQPPRGRGGFAWRKVARAAAAPEPAPAVVAAAGMSVSGAIRKVLAGRGGMTAEVILKEVAALVAPRVTTLASVRGILYQLSSVGELKSLGDGLYALAGAGGGRT